MKKYVCLLAAVSLIFLLAACSGTPTLQSDTPNIDKLKAKGKITMLTNADFPPFEYVGHGGKIEGIDIDIANEIANDLDVSLEVLDMNFDFLIDSLKSDKGDFAAAGLTITPERKEQVVFSIKYVTSSQYMIIKSDSNLTPDDLKDSVIAVQQSTKGDFYATDDIKCENVMRFQGAVEAGQALISGKCDAIILDELPAYSIANANPGTVVVYDYPLTSESYAFAIKKDKTDLLDAINQTLIRLMRDGKINEFIISHS